MKRALLIGCGGIGAAYDLHARADSPLTHAGVFQKRKDIDCFACLDPDQARAEETARAYGFRHAYSDPQVLLQEDHNIDVVAICSPTGFHDEGIALAKACQAKWIVCEKPIAPDLKTSEQILADCADTNITLAINYFRLWDQNLIDLSQRIFAGEFGKLQGAQGAFVKGILHNGGHLINLLRDLIGPLSVRHVSSNPLLSCLLEADDHVESQIQLQELSPQGYNFFELTLYFEKMVVHLEDGARRIRLRRPCPHPLYPDFLYPENEKTIPCDQTHALSHLYDELLCTKLRRDANWCLEGEKLCHHLHQTHQSNLNNAQGHPS